jgi:hypothetical protein
MCQDHCLHQTDAGNTREKCKIIRRKFGYHATGCNSLEIPVHFKPLLFLPSLSHCAGAPALRICICDGNSASPLAISAGAVVSGIAGTTGHSAVGQYQKAFARHIFTAGGLATATHAHPRLTSSYSPSASLSAARGEHEAMSGRLRKIRAGRVFVMVGESPDDRARCRSAQRQMFFRRLLEASIIQQEKE